MTSNQFRPPVTSVRVQTSAGGHNRVDIWIDHGHAGTLVMPARLTPTFLALLRADTVPTDAAESPKQDAVRDIAHIEQTAKDAQGYTNYAHMLTTALGLIAELTQHVAALETHAQPAPGCAVDWDAIGAATANAYVDDHRGWIAQPERIRQAFRRAARAAVAAYQQQAARITALEAENARLRAALNEFVKAEDKFSVAGIYLSRRSEYACVYCDGWQYPTSKVPFPHKPDCPITIARAALAPGAASTEGEGEAT